MLPWLILVIRSLFQAYYCRRSSSSSGSGSVGVAEKWRTGAAAAAASGGFCRCVGSVESKSMRASQPIFFSLSSHILASVHCT
jgi:hypothetical protein